MHTLTHTPPRWLRPRRFAAMALVALFAANLVRDVDGAWTGFHDWNGAFYSYLARNLLRYPIEVTRLLPVVAIGPTAPAADAVVRYANHPPGIEWLLAGSFALLGESEASARLVPITASLLTLWLLLRIVSATHGPAAAVLAGLFFATMPMTAFFGRMVDQEPLCLLCMMSATWAWFARTGRISTVLPRGACRAILWAGLAGGILIDWVCVLFAGVLFVAAVWSARRGETRFISAMELGIVAAIALAAVLLHLVYGGLGGSWAALADMFFSRSSVTASVGKPLRDIASRGGPLQMTLDNVGGAVFVLALPGMFTMFRGARVKIAGPMAVVTLVGVAWVLLFWPQFLRHNYWQYYLAPTFATAAACGVLTVHDWLARRSARTASNVSLLLAAAAVCVSLHGANGLFSRRSFSPELIRAWKAVAEKLSPHDRVVLVDSPYKVERRGVYEFRNIVPPHMVYYLDRPLFVEDAASRSALSSDAGSVLLVTLPPSERAAAVLSRVDGKNPRYMVHPLLVADLEPGRGRVFGERVR